MKLSEQDNKELNEEVQRLSQLTNYPQAVIRDIIEADRMYILDKICDDMHEVGFLPARYSFYLPGYGEISLRRLAEGGTTDAKWSFLPSQEFINGFFNSFYYGISPIYETMKGNFDNLLENRKNNLLKGKV